MSVRSGLTIVGEGNKGEIVPIAIGTIVERQTGFLFMEKLPEGKVACCLTKAVVEMLLPSDSLKIHGKVRLLVSKNEPDKHIRYIGVVNDN